VPSRLWLALIGVIAVLMIALLLIYLTINPSNDDELDDPRLTPLAATEQRRMEFARLTHTPIAQTAAALGLDYNEYSATRIIEDATQTADAIIQTTATARAIIFATRRGTQRTPTPSITVTSVP
jgi:hypothetical protein